MVDVYYAMNPKALKLLSCLRENSREKLSVISRKTSLPISTLFDTLKELESEVISRHTSLVDFSKLGFDVRVQVLLKVPKDDREKLKKHLLCHQNTNSLYKTNHNFNFIVECLFRNLRELNCFIENLENNFDLLEHKIHYLIEEVKKEGISFCVG